MVPPLCAAWIKLPTGSSSTGLGQPAAALITDGILAVVLSSFLMLAQRRKGREGWNSKSVIQQQQQLPWDRVGGEEGSTRSVIRTLQSRDI